MADTPWAAFTDQAYVDPANSFLAETAAGSGAGVNIPGSSFVAKNSAGKYGAGTTAPLVTMHINGAQAAAGGAAPTGALLLTDTTSTGIAMEFGISGGSITSWVQSRAFNAASYYNLSLNPAGGLVLIGATAALGGGHRVSRTVAQGNALMTFDAGGTEAVSIWAVSGTGYNPAGAAMYLNKDSGTGRTLAGAGTGNFNGSDYAEYLRKALAWIEHEFLKGELMGINSDGELTPKWSEAHSWIFKTYDPSIVGGDSWAKHLGPKPEAPAPIGPAPVLPPAPDIFNSAMPERAEGEGDQAFTVRVADWLLRSRAAAEVSAAYSAATASYPAALDEWTARKAAYDAAKAEFDIALPLYESAWNEANRAVDRAAFCGQVPVIVTGEYAPGQYLVAEEGPDDTIICRAWGKGDLIAARMAGGDMEYRIVAKVWAVREVRRDPRPDSADTTMVTRAWANVLHR